MARASAARSGARRGTVFRLAGAHIGSGKCVSSAQRGIMCQCRCGTILPKLARLILVGCIRDRKEDSTTHTAFIRAERSSIGRSVISAAWRLRITRQKPGHAGSFTATIRYRSLLNKMSSPLLMHRGQGVWFTGLSIVWFETYC